MFIIIATDFESLQRMFAVIDIETTGGSSSRDRITEIAVILHDGYQVEHRYSTLINPERPIPYSITQLTGISDDMVADAPRFFEVAKEIVQLTEGRIFVAHNVHFDYGFIKEEFKRLAYEYKREILCTVRTSRILIPGQPTYSLGRLCQSLGIPLHDRHRALGDAEATAILLGKLVSIQPTLGGRKRKDPFADIAAHIPRETLRKLPEDPGIFFIHDDQGEVLKDGATANIRQEVLKLLKATKGKGLDISAVQDVTWEVSGSLLMAQLEWLQGVRLGQSASPKASKGKFAIHAYQDQRGYLRLGVVPAGISTPVTVRFDSAADAKSAIEGRIKLNQLCPVLCGLMALTGDGCGHESCLGACMGNEAPASYNQRVEAAMQGIGFPHRRFLVMQKGRAIEEVGVVLVESGHCTALGYLTLDQSWADPSEVAESLGRFKLPHEGGALVREALRNIPISHIKPF